MSVLAENPLPIAVVGALLATLAGIVFFSRRTLGSLLALAGVVLATAALLAAERLVVTESEQVEAGVAGVMAAVEANDLPGVREWIDPAAKGIVADADKLMPIVRVARARATGKMQIEVQKPAPQRGPQPTATAAFRAFLDGTLRNGGARLAYFDDVEIAWIKHGDRWLISGYTAYHEGKPIDAVSSARGNRPVPAR